jgi:hypothetical protein
MEKQNRRTFVASAVALGASAAASAMPTMTQKNKKQVVHHVFFWLKNRDSKEDLNKLIEGLKKLEKIETIKKMHIGVPASTEQCLRADVLRLPCWPGCLPGPPDPQKIHRRMLPSVGEGCGVRFDRCLKARDDIL